MQAQLIQNTDLHKCVVTSAFEMPKTQQKQKGPDKVIGQ